MPRRARLILCHDCGHVLVADDRRHYGYQCHACVVVEHDVILRVARDPDHPDAGRVAGFAVDVGRRRETPRSDSAGDT